MENQETGHQSSSSTWNKSEETFPIQWFNRNRRTHGTQPPEGAQASAHRNKPSKDQ